ncbi:hypothetical protein M404DRAFT_1005763 [Pisolithus tinctorius Marx 270]|uniref:Uncharacterized protein n=1 Tax=Pisolithus tinctorius Marx 270 TaxID=870435 RepID=A0A0C3JK12_PISTI|nr:hypothetical protein M404DRAFT_1005763 [Pisolithus tinctorius Marx 270]
MSDSEVPLPIHADCTGSAYGLNSHRNQSMSCPLVAVETHGVSTAMQCHRFHQNRSVEHHSHTLKFRSVKMPITADKQPAFSSLLSALIARRNTMCN